MWKFLGTNTDERMFLINGINVWAFKWQDDGPPVTLRDPHYQQEHRIWVYKVSDGDKTVRFAAGEFSNGVWGFYIPE